MKRVLLALVLALSLLAGYYWETPPAVAASGTACSLQTLVITAPNFTPDWILDTVTGLNPDHTYTVTLRLPDGTQIHQDIDYGTTSNIQAFAVGLVFLPGTYSADVVETGRHRVLATCSLTL